MACACSVVQAMVEFLFSKFLTGEIFLHQMVGTLGNGLHQGFLQLVDLGLHVCRHVDLDPLASFGIEGVGQLGNHIDDARHLAILDDRQGKGNHSVAKAIAQGVEGFAEIGIGLVHAADKEITGQVLFPGLADGLLGADGYTILGADQHQDAVCDTKGLHDFAHEVKITRGVEQIELDIFPFAGSHGGIDRNFATDFLGIKVQHGVAIGGFPKSIGDLRVVQDSFRESRFARSAVA